MALGLRSPSQNVVGELASAEAAPRALRPPRDRADGARLRRGALCRAPCRTPVARRRRRRLRAPGRSRRSRPCGEHRSAGPSRAPRGSRSSGRGHASQWRRVSSPAVASSQADQSGSGGGVPPVGMSKRRSARVDRNPVALPSAYGELAESASRTGSHGMTPSKARSAVSASGNATWMWRPQTSCV